MAKSSNFPEKQTWGTWEELLLACAVHRYGADSWDSLATEVQKRSSSFKTLTGHSCKVKYHDLKSRFTKNDAVPITKTDNANSTIPPWLEELKKLRVAELKREVERYDLSIVSLQLKVKKLKEEREQSLKENERETENSDLEKATVEGDKAEDDVKVGKPADIAGEDSDREDRSVNESNSTDPKAESTGTAQGEDEKKPEQAEPARDEPERTGEEAKSGGEDSCNSVAEESAGISGRDDPASGAGDSAESKGGGGGGEENMKESNSDMQSSASLSSKDKKVADSDEPENEDHRSSAMKSISVESQPLVDFLEMLRSHKLGSLFERRLETQEAPNYMNLIRQHIDLETIQIRLDERWYSGCNRKFFRDLLLLFNNAIVFFGKKSSEYLAAIELRQLVSKELASMIPMPDLLPKERSLVPQDPEPPHSLAVKPKMRVLMIACRKRSSIATKASSLFLRPDKKAEQKANSTEEKLVIDLKEHNKSIDKAEETRVTKKRTRERFTLESKSTNKNKSRTNMKTNKTSDAYSNTGLSTKAGSQNENLESRSEKEKKSSTNTSSKKKGAANFLDRMKRSSPSNNGSLLESLKQPVISSDNSKGSEQKKSANSKSDARKDQNSRKGSAGKPARERRSSGRRNVGRPPKRSAAPPTPPAVFQAKRAREAGSSEAGASGHAKKRSRR